MLISMEPVRRLGVYGRTRERAVGLAGWVRSRGSREGITRRWGGNCPGGIFSAAPTSLLEAEVHGDGDEISAIAFDGFDLDARGCGPGQRQERDQRRQDPGARHRDRALLVLPAALVRIEIIIGWGETRLPAQLCLFPKRRTRDDGGPSVGEEDPRWAGEGVRGGRCHQDRLPPRNPQGARLGSPEPGAAPSQI